MPVEVVLEGRAKTENRDTWWCAGEGAVQAAWPALLLPHQKSRAVKSLTFRISGTWVPGLCWALVAV